MGDRIIRRRSSLVPLGRGPGRQTEWFGGVFLADISTLAANTFAITHVMSAAELAKRPFTITRTIGSLFIASDQVGTEEFPFGAWGGMVVSSKAVATGATAVPDPVTQVNSDEWFVYVSFAAQGGTIHGAPFSEFKFDSRAQRKVQDGDEFVLVMANASATDGLFFILNLRILVKLS